MGNKMDGRDQYYQLAKTAISLGIITLEERDLISRVGSRKQGYWSRHLRDLQELIISRVNRVQFT